MSDLPWSDRVFARESYLVREGEPTSTCSLLLSGFAFRQKLVDTGVRQIVSIHIPGELLDVQNAFLPVADHNVQSVKRAAVATVQKNALASLMDERPQIRRAIWLDTILDASIFREWVVNVGQRDAKARIAHLLCEFVARLKLGGRGQHDLYDFPFTQEQIADATGMTPVHANRMLQWLRKEGLISLSSGRLAVFDWDSLTEIGDFNERYLHPAR